MMKMKNLITPIRGMFLPHSANTPRCSISNPTHAQLQQLLIQKSKVGFDKLEDALVVFDKMRLMKPLLPVINFNQLLAALVKKKHYYTVLRLFRDMRVLRIPVNIITLNTVINCSCHLNKLDYGFSVLAGIIKRGFVPNVVTYTTLIRGLILQDKPAEARLLFQNLIRYKLIQPDVVTFTTIIDSLCKRGHTSAAVTLFRYMEMQGCKPDAVTYSTVIDCLCKHGLLDQALSFFQMMESSGLVPDICIYTILLDGLSKNGHFEGARSLFNILPSEGLRPNVKTYTIMIQAFCDKGLFDEAKELFVNMDANDCLPNEVTYNTLIRGCFRNKKYNEACVLIDEMRARGFSSDASTASVFQDLLKSNDQDIALLALRMKFLPYVQQANSSPRHRHFLRVRDKI